MHAHIQPNLDLTNSGEFKAELEALSETGNTDYLIEELEDKVSTAWNNFEMAQGVRDNGLVAAVALITNNYRNREDAISDVVEEGYAEAVEAQELGFYVRDLVLGGELSSPEKYDLDRIESLAIDGQYIADKYEEDFGEYSDRI